MFRARSKLYESQNLLSKGLGSFQSLQSHLLVVFLATYSITMFGSLSTSLIALLATAAIASPQGWPSGGASSQGWSSGQPCKPTKSTPAATTTNAPPGPSSSPYANSTNPDGPPYLNDLAKAKGKLWFGSATDQPGTGEDTDIAYQTILNNTDIFGQLTPANYMKVRISMLRRGPVLTYHSSLPRSQSRMSSTTLVAMLSSTSPKTTANSSAVTTSSGLISSQTGL